MTVSTEKKKVRVALPKEVTPVSYELEISPNLVDFTFTGRVCARVVVSAPVKEVVVNSADLKFVDVRVKQGDSNVAVDVGKVIFDEKNETASIPVSLAEGEATVEIGYSGEINDKLKGFYRSKWTKAGEPAYLGTTQFESVDARRALPCWDEPATKATFQLTLIVPEPMTAISNMPELSTEVLPNGTKKVVFDKSPIMSSYLLAWVIGEIECLEETTTSGTLVRAFTVMGALEDVKFSLDVAKRCLPLFEDIFGIKYPLPKLDIIAIPDFSVGAMENWGLVTFRDSAIFCNEKSSQSAREWVTMVVCHELAHQWFGNLVTMEWWSQLWLNEGFASFMQYNATDKLFPKWKMWETFVSNALESALRLDALESSHPIEVEVFHPSEIDSIFDMVSYCKGGSVVRMCYEFLGEKAFNAGVTSYLKAHSYKNAVTTDLWHHLGEASGKDVNELMGAFTLKQGYPVISVEESMDGGKLTLSLTQSRFLSTGKPKPEDDEVVWKIPLLIAVSGEAEPQKFLMTERSMKLELAGDVKWYKLNATASGVYRVNYPIEAIERLKEAVRSKELSALDRMNLISDVASMAKAGYCSATLVLELAKAFEAEDSQPVWAVVASSLASIKAILRNDPCKDKFDEFGRGIFASISELLGWDVSPTDTERTKQLRGTVLSALASYEDSAAGREGLARFQKNVPAAGTDDEKVGTDGEKAGTDDEKAPEMDRNVQAAVFTMAAKWGGRSEWERLQFLAETSSEPFEKICALRALSSTNDVKLLEETIAYGMSGKIRDQDIIYCIPAIAHNPKGSEMYWAWLQKNFDDLKKRFPAMSFMKSFIQAVGVFCSSEKADEVEAFFAKHSEDPNKRAMQQTVESIRVKAAWLKRDGLAIAEWMNKN
eukprot:173349_1